MKALFARISHRGDSHENSHSKRSRGRASESKPSEGRTDGNLYYAPPAASSNLPSAAADIGLAPAPQQSTTTRPRQRTVHRVSSLGTLSGLLAASKAHQAHADARKQEEFQTRTELGRRASAYSALTAPSAQSPTRSAETSPKAARPQDLPPQDEITARPSLGRLAKSRIGSIGSWAGRSLNTPSLDNEGKDAPSEARAMPSRSGSDAGSDVDNNRTYKRNATTRSTPSHPPSSFHFDPSSARTKRKGASPPIPSALPRPDEDVHPTVFIVSNANKHSPSASRSPSLADSTSAAAKQNGTSAQGTPAVSHEALGASLEPNASPKNVGLPRVDSTLSIGGGLSPSSVTLDEGASMDANEHQVSETASTKEAAGSRAVDAKMDNTPGETAQASAMAVGPFPPGSDAASTVAAPTPVAHQEQFEDAGKTPTWKRDDAKSGPAEPVPANAGQTLRHQGSSTDSLVHRTERGRNGKVHDQTTTVSKRLTLSSLLKRKGSGARKLAATSPDSSNNAHPGTSPQARCEAPVECRETRPLSGPQLAAKLSELAVSHADGLLSDEEYRLLRQNLFEQMSGNAAEAHADDNDVPVYERPQSRLDYTPTSPEEAALNANLRGGAFAFARRSVLDQAEEEADRVDTAGTLSKSFAMPQQRARLDSSTSSARQSMHTGSRSVFRRNSTKSKTSDHDHGHGHGQASAIPVGSGDKLSSPMEDSSPGPLQTRRMNGHSSRQGSGHSPSASHSVVHKGVADGAASPSQFGSSVHSGSESVGASSSGVGGRRPLRPGKLNRLMSSSTSRHSGGDGSDARGGAKSESGHGNGKSSNARNAELEREIYHARMNRSRAPGSARSDSISDKPAAFGDPGSGLVRNRSRSIRSAAHSQISQETGREASVSSLHLSRGRALSLPKSSRAATSVNDGAVPASPSAVVTPASLAALASNGAGFDAADWRYAEKDAGEIEAEIRIVEAEGKRLLESFDGLENALLRKAGPDLEDRVRNADGVAPKTHVKKAVAAGKGRREGSRTADADRWAGAGAAEPPGTPTFATLPTDNGNGAGNSSPIASYVQEMREIRSRRGDVAARYNERLAFLQSKVRSAQIRQKLSKS
ncbi:unnamed protein product [Parajaminaea phylloscopi]